MKIILSTLLLSVASLAWSAEEVVISDPQQVTALSEVSQRLDTVSDAVMACLDSGKPHAACMCASRSQVLAFNQSVADLFAAHPQLDKYELVRFKGPDRTWITHNLPGLRKQAATVPDCP